MVIHDVAPENEIVFVVPAYSYSVPTISSATVEWNFGTSSYQGGIHQGMPTLLIVVNCMLEEVEVFSTLLKVTFHG